MVNQCMNINCSKRHQPTEYEPHCFTCGHPLAATPDYGSSLSTTSTPYIHSGPFPYGHASPANSASFYNSPAGYSPSAPNPPAFSLSRSEHNPPIPRRSPVILHQSPGYISTTSQPNFYPHPSHQSSHVANPGLSSNPEVHNQSNSPAEINFVPYNPKAEKAAKETKSCIPCYRSNRKCQIDKGSSCCQSCLNKSRYCKGAVERLRLCDTGPWFRDVTALIVGYPNNLGQDASTLSITVRLNQSSAHNEEDVSEVFDIDLRFEYESTGSRNDPSKWAKILDAILPKLKETTPTSMDTKFYDLDPFERLCRRFAACMVTIRNMGLCTMDSKVSRHHAAPYIMLDLLHQLSNESCRLYQQIFDTLIAYLNAPRTKTYFSKQMFTLASCLGLTHKALTFFGSDSTDRAKDHLKFGDLFSVPSSVLAQLKYFGDTFNAAGFKVESERTSLDLPGFHLMLPASELPASNSNSVCEAHGIKLSESISFSEIFEQHFRSKSTSPEHIDNEDQNDQRQIGSPLGSPIQEKPVKASSPLDHASPSVTEGLRNYSPHELEHRSRIELKTLEGQLKEKHEEINRHIAEKASIEDKIRLLQLCLPSRTNTDEGKQILDESSRYEATLIRPGEDHPKIVGAHVIAKLTEKDLKISPSDAGFEFSDIRGVITASPVSEDESDCSITEANMAANFSKRKGSSNIFLSLKKPRVTELMAQHESYEEKDVIMSEPVDDQRHGHSASNDLPSLITKQRLSRILTTRLSVMTGKSTIQRKIPACVDITPEVPRFNPDTERPDRPLSWPRTRRWRKSFGVSVRQLRANFEKLTIDRVEHLPPRPIG